jgi:hypothetical protein
VAPVFHGIQPVVGSNNPRGKTLKEEPMSMVTNAGKVLAAGVLFIVVAGFAGPAWAHHPIVEKDDVKGWADAIELDDLTSSYAVYARIEKSGDVDFHRFDVQGPADLKIGILVPHAKGYEEFFPAFAVIGPGLPPPETALPFPLPEGYGAVVKIGNPGTERPTFFEPFSMTRYYKGVPEFEAHDPALGTYYIAVFHPGGEAGSYCLTFGSGEKWKLSDLPQTIKDVIYIQSGGWIMKRGKK